MSNSVAFKLIGAPGGTLIDPAGPVSAVEVLRQTYGDRLDWHDLLEAFEEIGRASCRERVFSSV